ncbi:prostaglandin reductase 1-like [Pectinophora gossypiella]|uniref:prostaglandin reductase 1-like n=1 Tax=Pectinophora gossypiella TaxID=13191 RepID=UPI00214F6152|nr:prostaglandin reductase 1-like [Pectinophora gossypiella]
MSKAKVSKVTVRKARKYMVKKAFDENTPTPAMFLIEEETLPPVKNGEFLVQAEYISVDPYMRSFASNYKTPYLQFAFQVGQVIESKNKEFPVNSYVVSHSGWCDYVVLNDQPDEIFSIKPYQPDLGNLSRSLAIGALGMPGMAAYLGFLEVCKPNKGEVVVVTSACGAVGSLVGQIARIKGCTVIGFTGSDQKVNVLKELGFNHAFNYKSNLNVVETIKNISSRGVDCYFDNVGGALSRAVMECMADKARIAICGSISSYDKTARQKHSNASMSVHIESFSFTQWDWETQKNALKQIRTWIESGKITVKETVTKGFDKLPDAFIGMLKGENIGKALVKV